MLKYHKADELGESINEHTKARLSDEKAFKFAEYDPNRAEKTAYSNYSYWSSTLQTFKKNKVALILLWVVFALVLFTFIQPYLPGQFDANIVNNDAATGLPLRNVQPNSTFWLGTNEIGQDLWSRLWSATRTSLLIGFAVACIEAVVGIIVGVLWGYVRQLDGILTELYNLLDNVPTTLILIIVAMIMDAGVGTIIFALSLTGWIGMARFVRNQIVIIRDRDYNLASRCLGTPVYRIIVRNLLPYLVSVIMLRMALSIPAAIGSEVFITYIGLGLPASVPSLGNLINVGRKLMMNPSLRYQLIYPTIVLSVVTISFYIVGNAFSDAADPKNHI